MSQPIIDRPGARAGSAYRMTTARELFNRHGLRCTDQRLALYEALRGCTSHPTADELYQMVRVTTDRLSLATVYNTLETFSKAGICRRIPMAGAATRYDADVSDHLHVRLQGEGVIHDVPADLGARFLDRLPQEVIRQIEERLGVRIDHVQVQLVGESVGQPGS